MKVAILGASGWIGNTIANEAKSRGHEVVALVRDPSKLDGAGFNVRKLDILDDQADLAAAVNGADALISSIGGRAQGNHDMVKRVAEKLLNQLPNASVNRLLWVGGAGSLEVAPGVSLINTPEFPAEYKGEATAQGEALGVFKASNSPVNWTFISPAAEIFPGDAIGHYRVGGDQLIMDNEGRSRISVADYAKAMIDELESGQHSQQRIGVAY
jgi:putative NADH-flavin reductase